MNTIYFSIRNRIILVPWLLISILIFNNTYSQSFEWAKRAGGFAFDEGDEVVVDNNGNIYIVGEIELGADFNSNYVSVYGLHDIFIAKYNASGQNLWVKKAGGIGGDAGKALCIDKENNLYITGEFEREAYFGDFTLQGNGTLNDIFIAKYNSDGVAQWAKRAGGGASDKGRGIAVDNSGNVYVVGDFKSTAWFSGQAISSSGDKDLFLAKYNNSGVLQWVKKAGGSGDDEAKGVCVDNKGHIYITGFFDNYCNFSGKSLNSFGGYDVFIAKYSTDGEIIWAKNAGGQYFDIGRGICYNSINDQLIVTGEFIYKGKFSDLQITGNGQGDVFIASYTSDGIALWVKKAGGKGDDKGHSVKLDKFGNIYMAGQFSESATFNNTTIVSAGDLDAFIASYSSSGDFSWVLRGGGIGEDVASGVAVDQNNGKVYSTGYFMNTAKFGSSTFSAKDHTDIFLVKIGQDVANKPSVAASGLDLVRVACDKVQVSWTNGSGDRRIVIARKGKQGGAMPQDGYNYLENTHYGEGAQLAPDCYVVYKGTSNNVTVDGFSEGDYYFNVIEFNGSGYSSNYNTSGIPEKNLLIEVFKPITNLKDTTICQGDSVFLSVEGGTNYNWFPNLWISNTTGNSVMVVPQSNVVYSVVCTNNMCADTLSINVNVFENVPLSLLDSTICLEEDIELSVDLGFLSYLWSNGSTSNSAIYDSTGVGLGSTGVWVEVLDSNGCKHAASMLLTFETCTSLPKIKADLRAFKVFPNPGDGKFVLEHKGIKIEPITLTVFNQIGEKVLFKEIEITSSSGSELIDLTALKSGNYYFKIESTDTIVTEKVVKY